MKNQKVPTGVGTIIILIIAITSGMFIWKYEKLEQPTMQPSNVVTQKKQPDKKNPLDNFKISDFGSWKTYKNEKIGIKMSYPQELYVNGSDEKVVFDYLSPDDSAQKNEGSTILHFNISQEQKTAKQYVDENKLNTLQNFKQAQIQLNGSFSEQITYTDAFAGGVMYTILIQNGARLIIVHYAGDNKLEKTFNKMLSTVNVNKTEKASFCGKVYNSDQMIINDTNIVKLIAKISESKIWICKNMELGRFQESGIAVAQKKEESKNNSYLINLFHRDNEQEIANPFNQSPFIFKFDFDDKQIFYQDQLDGKFKFLGSIK